MPRQTFYEFKMAWVPANIITLKSSKHTVRPCGSSVVLKVIYSYRFIFFVSIYSSLKLICPGADPGYLICQSKLPPRKWRLRRRRRRT